MSNKKKTLFSIERSYKEFQILHEQLKKMAKEFNLVLEKLPNKGNIINFYTKECEQKILNFRKFGLAIYLKYLLNDETFKDCAPLSNFISRE